MADLDLDAIRDRAAWSYDWLCKDARERTGSEWLPLSVRDTFDYGVPALVAEVRRLTAALAAAEAKAEDTTGGKWVTEYGRPLDNGRVLWHTGKRAGRDTLQRRVWRCRAEPVDLHREPVEAVTADTEGQQ